MGQGFYESGGAEFGNREKFPHRCFGDIFLAILLLFFLYFFNSHAPIILLGRLVLFFYCICMVLRSRYKYSMAGSGSWAFLEIQKIVSFCICVWGAGEQGAGRRGEGSGVGGGLGGGLFGVCFCDVEEFL